MLKSKSIIPHDRPVYREVIPQALKIAWKNPLFWLIALFVGILNTGSSLDAFWKLFTTIQTQGTDLFIGQTIVQIWSVANQGGFSAVPFFQGLLAITILSVIMLAVGAFACVCQSALVHVIGNHKDGTPAKLKAGLRVGARALVPIAVLNLIIMLSIWVVRFLVSFPLSIVIGRDDILHLAVYLVSFVIFVALALVLGIIQIYAVNAMILQGASLAQAFQRAWLILKEHWLVTVETAALQAVVVILTFAAAVIAIMVLSLPPSVMYILSILNGNFALFQISIGVMIGLVLLFVAIYTGFIVTFQYALWTLMFRKMGEGGIAAKLHRMFRAVTRDTRVPQS